MVKVDLGDQAAFQAAVAALLTLQATIPGASGITTFGIDGETMSMDEAVNRLVGIPKPVSCTAWSSDDVLKIRCEHVDETGSQFDLTMATPITAAPSDSHAEVLFSAANTTFKLTRAALHLWAADYTFTAPLGIAGDYPSPDQRAQGISWVIRISGAEAVTSSSLDRISMPDDLRKQLQEEIRRIDRKKWSG